MTINHYHSTNSWGYVVHHNFGKVCVFYLLSARMTFHLLELIDTMEKKICDHQGWVTSYFPWIIPLIEHAYYLSKYVGSHKPHNLFYHSFGIQILFHVIKSLPPLLYPMVHLLFIIRTMIICSYSAARIVWCLWYSFHVGISVLRLWTILKFTLSQFHPSGLHNFG